MTKRIITNARIIDPAGQRDEVSDLYIDAGKVTAPFDVTADVEKIDAKGLWVLPGLIDLNCHVSATKQNVSIATELHAALAGGITQVCCMPDQQHSLDTVAAVEALIQQGEQDSCATVLPVGALTQALAGERVSEMAALREAGCVAFSNARYAIKDTDVLANCFAYAATYDLLLIIQAQDPWLAARGCAHEGKVANRLGLPSVPSITESIDVARCLQLAAYYDTRIHFTKLSSHESVELIRYAKRQGLAVSADVSIHHLFLSEIDTADFNPQCYVEPPLRGMRDLQALQEGVIDGTIDAICSDHRPLDIEAKMAPFAEAEPGISSFETFLSLAFKFSQDHNMPVVDLVAKLTRSPANILRIPQAQLTIGADADYCLFDPEGFWSVQVGDFISQGHNTPFQDWELPGKIRT